MIYHKNYKQILLMTPVLSEVSNELSTDVSESSEVSDELSTVTSESSEVSNELSTVTSESSENVPVIVLYDI